MRRWLLLVVLLSLTAWAALALATTSLPATHDATAIALDANDQAAGTTGDPDARWEVAYRPGLPLPESTWKLSPPRADLAGVAAGMAFTATDVISTRPVPGRSVPTSLLHIPLLI